MSMCKVSILLTINYPKQVRKREEKGCPLKPVLGVTLRPFSSVWYLSPIACRNIKRKQKIVLIRTHNGDNALLRTKCLPGLFSSVNWGQFLCK